MVLTLLIHIPVNVACSFHSKANVITYVAQLSFGNLREEYKIGNDNRELSLVIGAAKSLSWGLIMAL